MQTKQAQKRQRRKSRTEANSDKYESTGSWKPKKDKRDDKDITFFSANINSIAYWSKYCNKTEPSKYMFDK